MMNIECMLNVIHHSLVKRLDKIENIHSWKFIRIFFNNKLMQLHEIILLDLNIQNFNESNLCSLKIFIVVKYASEDLMLNLSFFKKHNFIHEFAHQHLRWRILCAQNERKRLYHWKTVSESSYMMFDEARLASSLFACNIHQFSFARKVTFKFFHQCNQQKKQEVSSTWLTQNLEQQSIIIHIWLLLDALYNSLNFSVTEENSQLTQIENTIVDQFLNVSKEFANFVNLSLKKSKFFRFTSFMITLFASRRIISLFKILCTIFLQSNSSRKRRILRNSFKQTWYDTSSLQLKCSCSLHLKKMKRCNHVLIIESLMQSFSRINVFFRWLMKLSIILQMSSNLLSLTSRTRSTNFAYKKNEWKMTFHTRFDLYEYLVMLFDLINALTFFQIYMNQTLFEFLNIICFIYLNDILIFSEIHKKHVHHVW